MGKFFSISVINRNIFSDSLYVGTTTENVTTFEIDSAALSGLEYNFQKNIRNNHIKTFLSYFFNRVLHLIQLNKIHPFVGP